ncbi:DUF983 domain-containing protein [Mesorhizobium sp. M1B.F.Ca.ET.045.04.1.1]
MADGPAFFSTSIVALPALSFALWLRLDFDPPYWVRVVKR